MKFFVSNVIRIISQAIFIGKHNQLAYWLGFKIQVAYIVQSMFKV